MKNFLVAVIAVASLSSFQALASERVSVTEIRVEKAAASSRVVCDIVSTGTPASEMPSLAERKTVE